VERVPPIDRILLLLFLAAIIHPWGGGCAGIASASNGSDVFNGTNATNQTQTRILIDYEGYALANGEKRSFYQGYAVIIKGVDPKGEKAWIELLQNGTVVCCGVFGAEDHLIYAKEDKIFNITIDNIYIGSEKDLAFFYVRQYVDSDLPDPVPLPDATPEPDASVSNASTTTSSATATSPHPVNPNPALGPECGAGVCIAVGMLLLSWLLLSRSRPPD
jgi:hypothetical protein